MEHPNPICMPTDQDGREDHPAHAILHYRSSNNGPNALWDAVSFLVAKERSQHSKQKYSYLPRQQNTFDRDLITRDYSRPALGSHAKATWRDKGKGILMHVIGELITHNNIRVTPSPPQQQ